MQPAYNQHPVLRGGNRNSSNSSYEIQVTREVSVDSRPESRKKMQYTVRLSKRSYGREANLRQTFPPTTTSQSRSIPYNHLKKESSDTHTTPFADFSFSNSTDVDSIQNTLTGGGIRSRVSSTLDLAQFLKSTSPPPSRGPSPIPHSRSNSTTKKFGLGFLKHHSSASKSLRPTPESQAGPMRLPDSVVAKTAANGKKYLLISVPTSISPGISPRPSRSDDIPQQESLTSPPSSHPPPPQVRLQEPAPESFYRRGTISTDDSTGTPLRPLSADRDHLAPPVLQASRSIQQSPALDEDLATTYTSYLTSQPESQSPQQHTPPNPSRLEEHFVITHPAINPPKKEEHAREILVDDSSMAFSSQSSREAYGRPTTAETVATQTSLPPGPKKHRFSVSSLYSESDHQKKHSRGLSIGSDTPSYKSVSIHPHGVPSRSSSNNPTVANPTDPPAHPAHTSRPHSGQAANRLPVPHSDSQRLSSTGSVAESIGNISDASSGVVMDAQVVQPVRSNSHAGYYAGSIRKPPRPGPAPTRALPSLPETLDDSKSVRSRRSHGAIKPEMRPPVAVACESLAIVESPIVANFFQPTSRPLHDPLVQSKLAKAAIANASASKEAGADLTETILRPGLKDKSITSPLLTADALRVSRKSREERVRARKMRDLQSIRARHENKKLDETLGPREAAPEKENTMTMRSSQGSQMSNATDSSIGSGISRASPTLSGTGRAASPSPRLSATGSLAAPLRRMSRDFRRRQNGMSPLMLVMEQEPATGLYNTREHEMEPSLRKRSSNATTVKANTSPTPPGSPAPSLPSSVDDALSRTDSKTTARTETPLTSAGPRDSMHSLEKAKEAEIDARLMMMERKNAVLEAALLAVLQTSAGFGASRHSGSSQGRWSGQTAASSMAGPSPLEVLMDSMGNGSS